MASWPPLFDATEEKTNFTRLARLVIDGGTRVLRDVLHSLCPPAVLPRVLKHNETKLQNLKSKGRIFVDQWEKLFPPTGSLPDAETFDITLLHLLLRETCCSLVEPVTGWHNMPADTDSSREAHIVRIKCFRNELCHSISTAISNDEFKTKWTFIARSLVALGLDTKEIDKLKTESIDHDTKRRVEEEMKRWKDLEPRVLSVEGQLQQLQLQLRSIDINVQEPRTPGLRSCLPDELPEAFGRSQDIKKTTEVIHNEAAAAVMITGAPGFGKTTVANKVAYELDRLQHVVFYCSLRSKASLNEVASSMILVCSTNQCQPPENPQHWLLNWSKQQLDLKITFVLDNADDALESQESRSQFVRMVCDMRNLSKQNITFVITSRKTFNAAGYHLVIEEIRLSNLPQDEATKLLLSKYKAEERKKLSQTKRMVELCGCVPLALCIVGSLLSDFEEDTLINSLEKELLDVLQDDEFSLENTIKTSFDLLSPQERKALATFSVFPGSFDFDAAKDVTATINQFAASQTMTILCSLKNRSLLEQPSSGKFQVHQLIQVFARKTNETNYHPQVFADVEKAACAHFISRLDDAAQLYWSKDKCRESIEAFNSERYNFEYFLQVYVKTMAEQPYLDPFLESCTKKFLDQFPQKCMYLEMCLLPSFYITVLKTLLMHFNKGNQPLHTVELLCLLANELRKIGRREDYISLMEQAKYIYHWNYTEFRTNGLSQVFFFNSYARLVFEKRINTFKKMGNNVYQIALILCDKKLLGHPERAVTKLLIGKHRKSIPLLQEATNLLTQCLGEHYMTAQGHKAIADVYFAHRDTEKELNMSLYHYMLALEMMKKCGMSGQKETTLTLKNYASCQRRKGNYEVAMAYLEKAKRIAEIELEDDHRWKVMIDTQLALLHEDFGFIEEAIAVMKNSLEMCCRLCLSVDHLGNRHDIWQFLDCYPEAYPEKLVGDF